MLSRITDVTMCPPVDAEEPGRLVLAFNCNVPLFSFSTTKII